MLPKGYEYIPCPVCGKDRLQMVSGGGALECRSRVHTYVMNGKPWTFGHCSYLVPRDQYDTVPVKDGYKLVIDDFTPCMRPLRPGED